MRIHYVSCHSVLEYDELKLFTEMGVEVFSNGAYRDPKGAYTLPRPAVEGAPFFEQFSELAAIYPKTDLPEKLIDPFDAIMIMHLPEALFSNWPKIKHKRIIWRSIGQSTPSLESRLKPLKDEGLQIVRYSLKEKKLPNFAGTDAIIQFYKDPDEYNGWIGDSDEVVNFTQTLLGRRYFCHYDEVMRIGEGFNFKVYGTGNEDLGKFNGGELPFELLKDKMRKARVFIYAGTWPAPYTLSIIEAMMIGIPVVAIGKKLAEEVPNTEKLDFYQIPEIITNGLNGFISDDIGELRQGIRYLLDNYESAKRIGQAGRETAIKLFNKNLVKSKWANFLSLK